MDKKKAKFLTLIALILAALFAIYLFDLGEYLSPKVVRSKVEGYGMLAPIVFLLFYIIATVIFLPGTPLTIASGFIFGTFMGTVYGVIGATIGAAIAFFISRHLGSSFIEDALKKKFKKLYRYDKKLEDNGFMVVLFLRLVPIFPFNGLNFALGLTKVKTKDYIIATFIGIMPGSFALAYFGGSVASSNIVSIIIATILFVLLSLSPSIHKRIKKNRLKNRRGN